MKRLIPLLLCTVFGLALCACEDFPLPFGPKEEDVEAKLDGNTLYYGDYYYTFTETDTKATLQFSHFPASQKEFELLQKHLLGPSKPGALALTLLSFEMYRRDRNTGSACIRACMESSYAASAISQLSQKFPKNRSDINIGDSYLQPYLIAACLNGATQDNLYQPLRPYKLEIFLDDSSYAKQGERTNVLYGYVYHYYVMRNAKKCSASVLVPDDEPYVRGHNLSNFTMAVPSIKTWDDTLK